MSTMKVLEKWPVIGRHDCAAEWLCSRTTLYVDERLLRELGRVTARLTVERDVQYTKTAVLEAALAYGLQHVADIPTHAFPPDARRSDPAP